MKCFFSVLKPIIQHILIKMSNDCPICMEPIQGDSNTVTTECGHLFHCSCLMKNTAHNGFGCPYCRKMMAELPNYEDESDDEESDDEDENSLITDISDMENNVLTSFRMFHQQLEGEEPEEEPNEENDEDYITQDDGPDYLFVADKLKEAGITFEQLVKELLVTDYDYTHGQSELDNIKESNIIFGQFNRILHRYRYQTDEAESGGPLVYIVN